MIAFKLKGGFLQLDNQTSVSLVWNSPLFDEESLMRAFAWDFVVPFTPLNNRLLNFAYRFDAASADEAHLCSVYINGLQALTGEISVQEIVDGYRVYFQNDTLSLKTVLDNELPYFLTDTIDLIYNDIIPNNIIYNIKYVHPPENVFDVAFTINGTTITTSIYEVTIPFDFQDSLNDLKSKILAAFPSFTVDTFNGETDHSLNVTLPNTLTISNPINCAVTLNLDNPNEAVLRQHAVLKAIDAAADTQPIIFPLCYAEKILPILTDFNNYINQPKPGGGFVENTIQTTKKWNNTLIPMLKVSYIIQKIADKLGLSMGGEMWTNTEFQKLILVNTVTLDDVQEISTYVIQDGQAVNTTSYYNPWKKKITLSNHVPKTKAIEFLHSIAKQFGAYFYVSNGVLYLRRKADLLASKPQNITQQISTNAIRHSPIKKKLLQLALPHDKNAPTFDPDYNTFTVSRPNVARDAVIQLFTFDFDTLTMQFYSSQHFSRRVPILYQSEGDTPNILIFYHGRKPFEVNTNYSYCTPDIYDQNGDIIDGAWTLAIDGATGLYNQNLKGVIEFEDAESITFEANLINAQLLDAYNFNIVNLLAATPYALLQATIKTITIKLSPTAQQALALVECLKP